MSSRLSMLLVTLATGSSAFVYETRGTENMGKTRYVSSPVKLMPIVSYHATLELLHQTYSIFHVV